MNLQHEPLVLIVDTDHAWSSRLSEHLTQHKFRTAIARNARQAIEMIVHLLPHAVVCELTLENNEADAVLEEATSRHIPVPVVMTAASATYESPAVASIIDRGAFDCVIKPCAVEVIGAKLRQALVNSNLNETVNRKLLELQIISSYSEKLMGLVDKYDVVKALFETAVRHFDVDFVGALIAQRRTHEFQYWSRFGIDQRQLDDFAGETAEIFNRAAENTGRKRRIVYKMIPLDGPGTDPLPMPPLSFRYVLPLCWDDLRFGAIFLGAVSESTQASANLALLSGIVGQTRIALTNTRLYGDMKENYIRTIKALAIAVDAKDTYTHGHSENVMNIAEAIAREMSIDEKTIGSIRDAGLLHDIGKIGIPGYILNKPGPLTYEEFNGIMKTHSTLGANIVRDVPFLRDLYKLILYHHEHYDGQGYPDGLKGEQIPLGARILHVADAFEAMTSNRPYRNSLGKTEAIHRLSDGSGHQFDPSIIAAFLRVVEKTNLTGESPTSTSLPAVS